MALEISGYTDPGVYIGEVVTPGAVSTVTVPLVACYIGIGNRTKRQSNEAIMRGRILDEAVTLGATPGQHDYTLLKTSNRKVGQTVVYKDTVPLDGMYISYTAATLLGTGTFPANLSTNNAISLSLDGKQPVTITISDGGGDNVTIDGTTIRVTDASIADDTAVTAQEVVDAINMGLAAAGTLGYGASYTAAASLQSGNVRLTSPLTSSASDVQLFATISNSAMAAVFGGTIPRRAPTTIRVADSQYSGSSVYKVDYVAIDQTSDKLSQLNIQSMTRVGSFAGVTSFHENVDYTRTLSDLSWVAGSAAKIQAADSAVAATYDLSVNKMITVSLDGRAAVTINLDSSAVAAVTLGYAQPGSAAAATAAEIVANINAVLAGTPGYGPVYAATASASGNRVILTSPTLGVGSFAQVAAPPSGSAVSTIFGLQTTQLPFNVTGVGSTPAPGVVYFATYEYTRPSNDYKVPKRFFTPDALFADVGFPRLGNSLAIAGSIGFENGAPSVMVIQVDDSTLNGAPTQPEFLAALNAAALTATCTEIVPMSTDLAVQVDTVNHVTAQSSPTEKNYRRGWFGMARGTLIGDRDTPDTFVYRAARTFQVPSDSPGRGRMILVAPGSASRVITREDYSSTTVDLDGSYIAAAVAAKMTSFTSPSETLLRKTISGFQIESFPVYLKGERHQLAQNGVTVITNDAGRLLMMDPGTTEVAGGGLLSFSEISAGTQKDAVTVQVQQTVDSNLVGVVPADLSSFLLDVKGYIANALRGLISTGAIGPFKTASGVSRDIDPSVDIQVFQSATNNTNYYFKYWFNLRYPAKRMFGEFSVDRAFFQ